MRCRMCNSDKLSKEFPPVTVSEKCQHPPLVCLQVSYRLNTVKVTLTYQFLYYNQHLYAEIFPLYRYSDALEVWI